MIELPGWIEAKWTDHKYVDQWRDLHSKCPGDVKGRMRVIESVMDVMSADVVEFMMTNSLSEYDMESVMQQMHSKLPRGMLVDYLTYLIVDEALDELGLDLEE